MGPGVRLRLGDEVVLEVTRYTSPCYNIALRVHRRRVRARVAEAASGLEPGLRARAASPGAMRAGDPVRLLAGARPPSVDAPPRDRTADAVIIGGGVTGVSIAFHLAARGVRRILVLERRFLGAGGTGRSVGHHPPALSRRRDQPDGRALARRLPALRRRGRRRRGLRGAAAPHRRRRPPCDRRSRRRWRGSARSASAPRSWPADSPASSPASTPPGSAPCCRSPSRATAIRPR